MKRIEKITTEQDVRKVLSYMTDVLGLYFHPYYPAAGYITHEGTPMFTDEESVHIDNLLVQSQEFCHSNNMDIYDLTHELKREVV